MSTTPVKLDSGDSRPVREVLVYTDGGCSGNPGPGGWAAVIIEDGKKLPPLSGGEEETTNNRMELTAVLKALECLASCRRHSGARVSFHTDSQYVKNGLQVWIHRWLKNGWKTSQKGLVKNRDLWEKLHVLNTRLRPHWVWVKGHSGNPYNELCDFLVKETWKKFSR